MKTHLTAWGLVVWGVFFAISISNAQITNDVRAHIDHTFVIGNTTLPPGDYTFHIVENSEHSLMTAINENDKTSVGFIVRATTDNHTPVHSELTFRKIGNTEFLNKIFESGSKSGLEVTETSREEQRLVQEGQQATMHTEEQK